MPLEQIDSARGLRLRPLLASDEAAAAAAHDVMAGVDGFEFLLDYRAGEPWVDYVQRLETSGTRGAS